MNNHQNIFVVVVTTIITTVVLNYTPAAWAATSTFVDGIVIGDTVLSGSLLLDVNGAIGATSICDATGANCFSPASVGGGVSGSGTAGYVPKFTAGSTLANSLIQDNGTNVGIGRAPSQKLDVNGNIVNRGGTMFFQGLSQSLYGDGGTYLYFDANDATEARFILRDSDNTTLGTLIGQDNGNIGLLDADSQWAIQHDTDAVTRWSINNIEQMRLNTTGLGIGTASPRTDLEVESGLLMKNGGSYLGLGAYYDGGWRNANAAQGGFVIRNSGGTFDVRSIDSQTAADTISPNTTRFFIGQNGNTGIGTSAPSSALDVIGGAEISGNTTVGGNLTADGNLYLGGDLNSGGSLSLFTDRADDGTYEWIGYYSGSSRAGIMLWDGAWAGCDAGKFCIAGDTHQLMLRSNTGNVYIDDEVEISGNVRADTYCRKGGGNCIDLIDYNQRVPLYQCIGYNSAYVSFSNCGTLMGYIVK